MKGKQKTGDKIVAGESGELKRKDYEKELERLHIELVKIQRWVVHKGLKVCIVFEGRDGAGKGGTIKAITERVSPRVLSHCCPAGADPTRKEPDVHTALFAAPSGSWRSRHFRSQLVQTAPESSA